MRVIRAASGQGTEAEGSASECLLLDRIQLRACGQTSWLATFFGPSVNPTSSLERRGTSREL